ncbi:MAG: hypothetical protein ABEH64_06030 [Salinirussus sp.]
MDGLEMGADGRPIVLATRDRVDALVAAVNRDGDEHIGPFPLSERPATVETLAANAVRAGCRPEHFRVVLAALEASLADEFNLYGILATTEPHWPTVVVNGPIIEELNLNTGANAYGQGQRANAAIGRALTLVYMNVAEANPGRTDMATHGGPHKLGLCVGENEEASPFDPLHVERGFEADESTVTVFGIEAPHNCNDHVADSAVGVLSTIADGIAIPGANTSYLTKRCEPHVVLSPEHANTIARDGWKKDDIKRFLYDHARIQRDRHRNLGLDMPRDGGLARHAQGLRDNQLVPLAASPERFVVTVTGGPGRHSLFCSSFGDTESVTRKIGD